MRCFKLFLCSTLLFSLSAVPVLAENWIEVNSINQNIMLDTDSVRYNNTNGSLYYNVKYYENKAKDFLIVTIQSANGMAGVVTTCKYSNYKNNKCSANTNTDKIAQSMNEITYSSLLYNADLFANSQNKAADTAREVNRTSDYGRSSTSSYTSERSNYVSQTSDSKSEIVSVKEPDFGPYMKDLQQRIKSNWNPPRGNESKRVVLLFKVAKDGRLLSCSVFQSSGMKEVDSAAIAAVRMASPFRPLPEEFKNQSVDIQFTFDYNVFGSNRN